MREFTDQALREYAEFSDYPNQEMATELLALRARVAQLEGALAALRDSESVPACFRTLADAALAQPAESRAKRMR